MAQISLPDLGFSSNFELVPVVSRNRLRSGASYARAIGRGHYWRADISVPPMSRADHSAWDVFLINAQKGGNAALLYDADRPYPASYEDFSGLTRHGGGAFDGTADIDEVTDPNTIVVGDASLLPSTFALLPGDMLGLVDSSRYSLHMVMAAATAVDGVVTLSVEPQITTNFDANSTVNFAQPLGEFLIETGPGKRARTPGPTGVSFSAIDRVF